MKDDPARRIQEFRALERQLNPQQVSFVLAAVQEHYEPSTACIAALPPGDQGEEI